MSVTAQWIVFALAASIVGLFFWVDTKLTEQRRTIQDLSQLVYSLELQMMHVRKQVKI